MTTERIAAPPPSTGAPPGRRAAEVHGEPFGTLFDLHKARTATAEGTHRRGPDAAPQEDRPAGGEDAPAAARDNCGRGELRNADGEEHRGQGHAYGRDGEGHGQGHGHGHNGDGQNGDGHGHACSDQAAEAAVPSGAQPAVPAQPATPALPGAGTETPAVGEAPAQPAVPAQGATPAAGAQPAMPATPAVPAEPGAGQVPVTGQTPPAAAAAGASESVPAGAVQPVVAVADARPAAVPAAPARPDAGGDHPPAVPATPAQPAKGDAGAQQENQRHAPAQAAVPAQPATPAQGGAPAQPATPAQPTTPAQPAQGQPVPVHGEPVRGARLDQAVESVQAVIRMGAARGVGHARIALSPADLGGIEIRLRSSAAGLVASVVADSPEAAHLLQGAADDLRRSLDAQGIDLLRLDIGMTGDERAAGEGAAAGQERAAAERAAAAERLAAGQADAAPDEPDTVIQLPNGVLVDVLA